MYLSPPLSLFLSLFLPLPSPFSLFPSLPSPSSFPFLSLPPSLSLSPLPPPLSLSLPPLSPQIGLRGGEWKRILLEEHYHETAGTSYSDAHASGFEVLPDDVVIKSFLDNMDYRENVQINSLPVSLNLGILLLKPMHTVLPSLF